MTASASYFRATLISMPWALFNRPSLQLAALKAYVEQEMEAEITTAHPFLQIAAAIGIDVYRRISETSWAGEALFAPLIFPGQRSKTRRLFRESLRQSGVAGNLPDYDELVSTIDAACRSWLARQDFSACRLLGFSVCFGQLLSSLHLARLIREQGFSAPIVFGGSSCSGTVGQALLRHFPQIDYIVDGEGERPLLGLCAFIAGKHDGLPEHVIGRTTLPTIPCHQLENLDLLPIPDFRPYFTEIKTVFPELPFIPVLPLEFSRGCWWNRCAFCNLNLQWQGYRHKSAPRMIAEVETQSQAHRCLDFFFTDNALPPRESDQFFRHQGQAARDRRFFAEIRGTTGRDQLAIYRSGGLHAIQVGIEALSNSLLQKMAKGLTVIDNIAVIRDSAAAGIVLDGNLILEFPGSTAEEVAETIANLDFLLPFRPLAKAVFFLGHGSPVCRDPRTFGIFGLAPEHRYRALLPAEIAQDVGMLTMDYRGGRRHQRRLWRPVADRIAVWREFHRNRPHPGQPALSYRDGGEFLIIRQERVDGPPLHHRLHGRSREIYLYCRQIRTRADIQQRFHPLSVSALDAFLGDLHRKRLLFQAGEQVLALAIRHSP
ncbi:RiPP maturation radical SAM C-methyltransferase [Desulfoprunum benzoelyticum]|uniref:Ribosomal peptide maturation radical SAM protein 1 n=1 Tax=Desulfoprunum benzoelyticum TaxID=1506996 RepID=A0A840V1E1_9BACT|nr:RiPP maturation radical SAM C-methyltransferase [Desulfoprunum benzoelyticum]MBB5347650.1 ribosomal peptide maturation radical SAM protein 1 [Desulfoprunum benzoelyticum]MBM9529222.1 RiPP maturation radical SAM C-methyltransferase [Desulfoprunum benzoelyticum]